VDSETAAKLLEEHRAHLIGVAYRMLGTLADAEDAVQETYLRFARRDVPELRDVRGWLTTAVARICLDVLGSARARRETYVGPWLPEPVVGAPGRQPSSALGPEDRVTLDESVSMAMLVVLESLSPAERTAFVLHDVLGLSYDELSGVVGRSEAACRQLVSRGRAQVRRRAPRFSPDAGEHSTAVAAFLLHASTAVSRS
jgi:RNA polymerase sigma-70 factor, ECF subfamily